MNPVQVQMYLPTKFLKDRYVFSMVMYCRILIDLCYVYHSRMRSYDKNKKFTYFNMLNLCMLLQIINKIKTLITHQDPSIFCKILLISIYLILFIWLKSKSHFKAVFGYSSLIKSRSHFKVKATSHGQGYIKVNVKNLHPSNFMQPILLNKWVVSIRMKCLQ